MKRVTQNKQLLTEPEPVRRKLSQAYRKQAEGRRFTPVERAEFARMADAWQATLPEKK